jgi:hypothetical protein
VNVAVITQPAAVGSLAIEIGGIPILLESTSPAFQQMVERHYPGFMRGPESPEFRAPLLHFSVEPLNSTKSGDEGEVRVWKQADRWCIRRGDFEAEVNLDSGEGRIWQDLNPYGLNTILRIVHTLYLAREHGFLLHAASAVRNKRAFVFSGVSGAGKTTISRCAAEDAVLLTDEISYIRRGGGQYLAWGTPFAGEMGTPGANISAPVAKLFFLEKGPENRIDDMDRSEALRRLLRNILFFSNDEEAVCALFDSACAFLERVPAQRLTFVPDASVWELIH